MIFSNCFKRSKKKKAEKSSVKNSSFFDFFLHASERDKEKIITQVAEEANKEQRRVFEESRMALKQ